jgi:hypothetical protein
MTLELFPVPNPWDVEARLHDCLVKLGLGSNKTQRGEALPRIWPI